MTKHLTAALSLVVLLLAACQRPEPNPWFGQWSLRAEDAKGDPETLIYSDAGDGAMRMQSIEARSVIVTRFDGTPSPDTGPNGAGNTLAVKATSPTRYSWTFSTDGKPFVQGENTLAADRQSFTEISWLVGKPEDKVTLIYQRR